VLFVDEFEEENGADESLLHSVEGNDSRGGATPMSGSGMMPSPVLLWRFKVFFFFFKKKFFELCKFSSITIICLMLLIECMPKLYE